MQEAPTYKVTSNPIFIYCLIQDFTKRQGRVWRAKCNFSLSLSRPQLRHILQTVLLFSNMNYMTNILIPQIFIIASELLD